MSTTMKIDPIPAEATPPAGAPGGYEASRFNAIRHGVLSRLAVLAHEDGAEFADLLAGLIAEFQPASMTEHLLTEELASTVWRKRRILLAEGAAIHRGLRDVTRDPMDTLIPSAAPFERGLSAKGCDLPELLTASPAEISERQRNAALDLDATHKAAAILRRGAANAYERARRALLAESRDWWDDQVEEAAYPATAEGLAEFIGEELEPICRRMAQEARLIPAIQTQTLGEGLQMHRLEKLNRYETHLDRKFERTLAMLLKLRELRGA